MLRAIPGFAVRRSAHGLATHSRAREVAETFRARPRLRPCVGSYLRVHALFQLTPFSTNIFVTAAFAPRAEPFKIAPINSSNAINPFAGKENPMDQDRIKGAANQAKGAIKEAAGKVTGDAKLEAEGKGDKVAGKVQNAIGGLKDMLRGE
jgi:uncharacterized protein YjbJ (UPF0337 family)